jgi:hypothetical protein
VSSNNLKPRFERIGWTEVDWRDLDAKPDRIIFQTRAWLEFLAESKAAQPVVAVLREGSQDLGFFTGLLVQRWGFRFLGSPMPGWTTPYMGFNMQPGVDRRLAAEALVEFAFRDLDCVHLELRDRFLSATDVDDLGFERRSDVGYDERTFEIDLSLPEETLFAQMTSACRRCIRKAEKVGVTVEEASDAEFADEFYAQLSDVFARQGLVPTYKVDRVKALIQALHPTGSLLLLRARDHTGRCIATGIFPGSHDTAYFWGGASWRAYLENRPNEALHWYAMRYWKQRGLVRYDLGGFMDYKRKYGGQEVTIPGFRRSKYPAVAAMRTLAPMGMRVKQSIFGRVRGGLDHIRPTSVGSPETAIGNGAPLEEEDATGRPHPKSGSPASVATSPPAEVQSRNQP